MAHETITLACNKTLTPYEDNTYSLLNNIRPNQTDEHALKPMPLEYQTAAHEQTVSYLVLSTQLF